MSNYDLLIVGGGINGTGIARDAAGRGLRVALVEQGDLAEATSSRSTKLIHGGLRYLEYYQFRLVREALHEREVLLRLAPHIIWPVRFVLPHSPQVRPAWLIRLGLWLYDHLGGRMSLPRSAPVDLTRGRFGAGMAAGLKPDYRRGFLYSDCWVDDSRLVILNAIDAAERGAVILPRTRLVSAERQGADWVAALVSTSNSAGSTITAKAIVNAAGPWVQPVIAATGLDSAQRIRLVKGSHIIVKKFWTGDHNYILQNHDRRIVFANGFLDGLSIIGTTDVNYAGDPAEVAISEAEIDYLLAAVNGYFQTPLTRDQVLGSYAGVRPLHADDEVSASAASRDYSFETLDCEGEAPLLSIFGGKITTYRRLAEAALERLRPYFRHLGGEWTARVPLPGGDFAELGFDGLVERLGQEFPWLPLSVVRHYARLYGTRTRQLLDGAEGMADLGCHFGGDFYEREATYLVKHEWATTPEDILLRRTKFFYLLSESEQQQFRRWFANHVVDTVPLCKIAKMP
ncbi:MAG: glycerol-3-phosphate dehydrogenase [Alphaproteobacteria bacterium]|nr:glycerol-3-phosphate dehydrogenase [Alphaproteobacteria bacterium]